jgi:hypothetical protein
MPGRRAGINGRKLGGGPHGELVRSITLGRILEPRNRQELPSLAMAAKMNIMHREEGVDQ